MEYNLDRSLIYKTDIQHKSLYKWAITEQTDDGRPIPGDQIPWQWSVYFTGTSCDLNDVVETHEYESDDAETRDLRQRQSIRIRLRVGYKGYGGTDREDVLFSMFGTGRRIADIILAIRPLDDENNREICIASGIASYTGETDFRQYTTDDWFGFDVFVKPEIFQQYVQYIRERSVDVINFSVSHVEGFYSEWSPSISTNRIKILLPENRSKIANIPDTSMTLPVLGNVGEFRLWFGSQMNFEAGSHLPGRDQEERRKTKEIHRNNELDEHIKTTPAQNIVTKAVVDLSPLKRVLWLCAALLALILLRLLAMN